MHKRCMDADEKREHNAKVKAEIAEMVRKREQHIARNQKKKRPW